MKYFGILLITTTFFLGSCNKNHPDVVSTPIATVQDVSSLHNKTNRSVGDQTTLICQGSCDCGLTGNGTYVECRCNECVMIVKNVRNGVESTFNLIDAQFDVEFIPELNDWVNEKFPTHTYFISEVVLTDLSDGITYLYVVKLNDGSEESVMFARSAGKTFRIDCTGSCGCRERYVFDPPAAECSCGDCVMEVQELQF